MARWWRPAQWSELRADSVRSSDVPPEELSPSSEISPWRLGGLTVRELAICVWREVNEDEVTDRAAALSYYFVFALFPALLFLTALLGLLPIPHLMGRFLDYVDQALPGDAASIVRKTLHEVVRGAHGGVLSIGALAALWAASNGMSSMMNALNVAYDVKETRSFAKRKAVALGLTLGFAFFILIAMVLMAFGPKLGAAVAGWFGLGDLFTAVWNVISVPIAMVLVGIGIALVYFLAPAAKQHWHWVTPGSVVALVAWVAMSLGLRFYISHFGNYNATYGSIGGVMLLLLWLYASGIVLLLGAEVNAEIEHAAAERGARDGGRGVERRASESARLAPTAGVPQGGLAMGRDPAAIRTDVELAIATLTRGLERLRRRGWLPPLLVAVGLGAVASARRGRRLREVAERGTHAFETALEIAAALAAWERYRRTRRAA